MRTAGKTSANTKHRRIPETLSDQERLAFLSQFNHRCPTGLRNLCIVRLMLNSGLRCNETLTLKISSLDWTSGRMKVRGKGRKQRVLWINEDDLELLGKWREARESIEGFDNRLLFTTLSGAPVNPRYIRVMVKNKAQKAGIAKDIHPHTLRHSFATDLYRQTKNLRLTQKALGHSNVQTTTIYTHIVDDELEDALKNLRQ